MSVPNQTPFTAATGNGISTSFPFEFLVVLVGDLVVSVDGVDLAQGQGYTVMGLGNVQGGAVNFGAPPASGVSVRMRREIALERNVDYQYLGDLPAATLNADVDRVWLALQGLNFLARGSVRAPYPELISPLPAAADRAGHLLAFDSQGNPTAALPVGGSASDLGLALMAPSGSTMVGFRQTGAGAVQRTVQAKLGESVSAADFGAVGDGITDDTLAIQRALDQVSYGGTVHLAKGTFRTTATLRMRANASLVGAGCNSTVIKRSSNFGHTLMIGDEIADALACTVRGILFQHGTDWLSTDTTLDSKLTGGSAHIFVKRGQFINIEYCWFKRMPFSVIFDGSAWCRVSNNLFQGIWDPTRTALQEGVASVLLQNGNVSSVFENNEFVGNKITRPTTIADSTGHSGTFNNFVDLVGSQYGLLIQGAEDLTVAKNFFGAQSQNAILFGNTAAGAGVIDIRIVDNMFDETRYGHVVFNPAAANLSCLGVTISNNIFNGEGDSASAIVVAQNQFSLSPSVYSLGIHDNRIFAYYASAILLSGACGFAITGNTITNYNCLGVSPDDLNFVTGILVNGQSTKGQISNNIIGGGGNIQTADVGSNFCYQGVYVDPAVRTVAVRNNFYSGIRSGSIFRIGPVADENQYTVTSGNYQCSAVDTFVGVNKGANEQTAVNLPSVAPIGREVTVKDLRGNAATFQVIVGTSDGTLIDGSPSSPITTNFGSRTFRFVGQGWATK